jgi:2-polyprenyl-3-methyl-5-hydroxy-6-metoxy-1,4-benzoquinol methylase
MTFPQSVTIGERDFRLFCTIPKIWTQERSRQFAIYWSEEINHGSLYPAPTDDELADFYRQEHYNRYLSGDTSAAATQVRFSAPLTIPYRALIKIAYLCDKSAPEAVHGILNFAGPSPHICDLGCGGGNFLAAIRERGASVVGVDPSEVSCAALQKKGIEFHLGTGDTLPDSLPKNRFDVVTMFHSLEHCRNVETTLENARSLLKEDGLCVIEVPNMECVGFQQYPEVWIHTDAGRHLQFFTQDSLLSACANAGLKPVKVEFTGFAHQFLPERVKKMQHHWDILFADGAAKPIAVRASLWTAVKHLAKALTAGPRRRYDIIRVYARKT